MKVWLRIIFFALFIFTSSAHGAVVDDYGQCSEALAPVNITTRAATLYPEATIVDSEELTLLFVKSGVLLPPTAVHILMSDQARARARNLKAVLPSLMNRRLIFRISSDDGHNSYLIGSVRRIVEHTSSQKEMVHISIESLTTPVPTEQIEVPIGHITQMTGINVRTVRDANEIDLQGVRGNRTDVRSLLGKNIRLPDVGVGTLVAASIIRSGRSHHVIQTGPMTFHWVYANGEFQTP